jgi:hypothetical protein
VAHPLEGRFVHPLAGGDLWSLVPRLAGLGLRFTAVHTLAGGTQPLTEQSVAPLLAADPPVDGVLLTDPDDPSGATLRTGSEIGPDGRRPVVTLTLPVGALPGVDEAQAVFRAVCEALRPAQAGLFTPSHRALVWRASADRVATDQGLTLPPGARLPDPSDPTELANPVPLHDLDLTLVPEAVWWVNYWSDVVIDSADESAEDARNALDARGAEDIGVQWHSVEEVPGGLLLVVDDRPIADEPGTDWSPYVAQTERLGLHRLHREA